LQDHNLAYTTSTVTSFLFLYSLQEDDADY
jgi:hypothetical protein